MPIAIVRIQGHPLPTSLGNDDWVVSRPSNTDDDPHRYIHKPENTADRWRIEHPTDYARQGRIVDVRILPPSVYSEISIDEDAIRYKRVFLTSDQQGSWPSIGERVEIIANPTAKGPWLCQSAGGSCKAAQPASNPGSQSALIGDKGKVIVVTVMTTSRSGTIGRIEIDVPRPIEP